ncbi:MAG: site-specific integrase [Desulfobulbus sp.]|nr:site-specific integrase [Desulfobulbus sp.]
MSIYARCCTKDHKSTAKQCEICGKSFTKYVVRVKDTDTGKWRTKTVPNLKLAKNIESKFKTESIEGKLFDKKQTGKIDFNLYLEHAKVHKKSWKDDYSRWTNHVNGNNHSTQAGVTKILATMKENGNAPATVDHVYKLIKRVYNWHIQNGLYSKVNPCQGMQAPKYDNRVTNYLTTEQLNDLFEYLDNGGNTRASNVIKFAAYTGRRKSEILNLEWKDVDLQERIITCRQTKNGRTLSFPLNEKAFEVIQAAKREEISNYVFCASNGNHYNVGFSLSWGRLKKRLGLTYRFHDLRHTYASHLASSGKVDIYTLKTLLGHQDVALTMRYAHLTDKAVKQATCVIDEIF